MRNQALVILAALILAGVGCFSVGSKAEPSNSDIVEMNETMQKKGFLENLPKGFEPPVDDAGRLLLREYGAVFLARNGAVPPKKVVFTDEADVAAFQSTLHRSTAAIGGTNVELQTAAMTALIQARTEAQQSGLSISPRSRLGPSGLQPDSFAVGKPCESGVCSLGRARPRITGRGKPDKITFAVSAGSRDIAARTIKYLLCKRSLKIDHLFGRTTGNVATLIDACP